MAKVLGFWRKDWAWLGPVALVALVVLVGGLAQAVGNSQTAASAISAINDTVRNVVCPLVNFLKGPLARLLSLVIFVGAIIYYLTNDSRTAKSFAVAAIIALILFNTMETWQAIFTQRSYDSLCEDAAKIGR